MSGKGLSLPPDARAKRAKYKRMHAEVQRLHAEVKKLRVELRLAAIALTSREEQLAFFERHTARLAR